MSATDRQALDTAAFTAGLRALADMLDTDTFDGVTILDERTHPDQGENLSLSVTSEEAVRAFAARHRGAELQEYRDTKDDHLVMIVARLGFGQGTYDATSGHSLCYTSAVTIDVSYSFPQDAARRVL